MEVATTTVAGAVASRRIQVRRAVGEEFEAFYRADADRVRRALAVTLGDAQVAGEAVDEAMTRALARWRHVRQLGSPSAWVYRVGLNWAISRWRKLRRESPLDERDSGAGRDVEGPDPSEVAIAAALRKLPVGQRSVIVCRILLDCNTAETAAALNLREGTVKSRLARGLAALRNSLSLQEEA